MRPVHLFCAVSLLAFLPASMAGADTKAQPARISAAEIVAKNIAARGGASAWHALQTLEMKGKMEAGGNQRAGVPIPGETKVAMNAMPTRPKDQVQLPFLMDLKRGHKQRVEIEFKGQTAVQVYDGSNGWKLRPFLNRREVEKFSPEELRAASADSDIDGYLLDYSAKGSKVELDGTEEVDGRKAYKLKVTDRNANTRHVWVDAETFLEAKIEGSPRRLDGRYHPVATYFHDYRTVNGLVMPYQLETRVEGVRDTEKITIESIVANPKLDDSRFAMPR